jgi:hypothetical protein
VRVNIEAVYEPPQIGEVNGVHMLNDDNMAMADMIAGALKLEKVGWVFTSVNTDTFLSSSEIRKIAELQQQHVV